jgi:NAD(P)-dependent dehydrogenase (short-subunit alcohol dehydrogenase family)
MINESLAAAVSLDGRRALVTGAGSGIGRATALTLAEAGACVLAADVNDEGLAAAKAPGVDPVTVDVSDRGAVANALRGETFDIVVNVAGIMAPDSLDNTTSQEWERVLAVNLTGYFNVLKCAVPQMKRPGSIIQISSMMPASPSPPTQRRRERSWPSPGSSPANSALSASGSTRSAPA